MLGFGEVWLAIRSPELARWRSSTVRNSNMKALLRSADAELRRAYFAGLGLALCWASAKYGLPSEAQSLRGGEVRQFAMATSKPSYARLPPSSEGHTSPDLGWHYVGLRRSMACHTKPRACEVAKFDSSQWQRQSPPTLGCRRAPNGILRRTWAGTMLCFGEVWLAIRSPELARWRSSTVRNGNVKALLRSAAAELRRAYYAGLGLALCCASAKYGLPYEAPSLRGGEVRQFAMATSKPSYARLPPSSEGHTSPDLGWHYVGLRRSMACHTKPRACEVAKFDSSQWQRQSPPTLGCRRAPNGILRRTWAGTMLCFGEVWLAIRSPELARWRSSTVRNGNVKALLRSAAAE